MSEQKENQNVNQLVNETFKKLRSLADSETIIGDPIITSKGTTIIPISKAVVGFVLGGGEFCNPNLKKCPIKFPMAGGSGGGLNLTPVGFLIEDKFGVNFIATTVESDSINKVMALITKAYKFFENKDIKNEKKK